MSKYNQEQCAVCQNADICKYAEEYKQLYSKIKESKHAVFEHTLSCKKFVDSRDIVK